MNDYIGIIPARYASSRLPGKVLLDIAGKPMLWWVYNQAKKASGLTRVLIAADDHKVCEACQEYGMDVLMTDPHHNTPFERIYEVAQSVVADGFVCLNADEPLLEPAIIDAVLPKDGESDHTGFFYSNAITTISSPVEVVDPTNIKVVFNNQMEAMWLSRAPIPFPKGNIDYQYHKFVGVAALSRSALDFYIHTPPTKLERIEEIDMYRFLENGKACKLRISEAKTLSVDTLHDLNRVREIFQSSMVSKKGLQ